jgi:hypothetical protein
VVLDEVSAEETHFREGDLGRVGGLDGEDWRRRWKEMATFIFHVGSSSAAIDSVIPSSAIWNRAVSAHVPADRTHERTVFAVR